MYMPFEIYVHTSVEYVPNWRIHGFTYSIWLQEKLREFLLCSHYLIYLLLGFCNFPYEIKEVPLYS